MGRFRVGIVDITIGIIVAVAIFLPPRTMHASYAYGPDEELERTIAYYQAIVASDPEDGAAVYELTRALLAAGQSDWAVEVGESTHSKAGDSPMSWRTLLAVSAAYARRIETKQSFEWAKKAMAACSAHLDACPDHERARLQIYYNQLEAGERSGIDPREDPTAYRKAVRAALRVIKSPDGGDE